MEISVLGYSCSSLAGKESRWSTENRWLSHRSLTWRGWALLQKVSRYTSELVIKMYLEYTWMKLRNISIWNLLQNMSSSLKWFCQVISPMFSKERRAVSILKGSYVCWTEPWETRGLRCVTPETAARANLIITGSLEFMRTPSSSGAAFSMLVLTFPKCTDGWNSNEIKNEIKFSTLGVSRAKVPAFHPPYLALLWLSCPSNYRIARPPQRKARWRYCLSKWKKKSWKIAYRVRTCTLDVESDTDGYVRLVQTSPDFFYFLS